MQKNSTQIKSSETEQIFIIAKPKKSTVNFLKQFARAYSFNSLLTPGLENFIAN